MIRERKSHLCTTIVVMSANIEAEIHIDSDDERTLPQDAETDREPHSVGDDRRMSQQRQLIQQPRWISEIEWNSYVQEDPGFRARPPSVVSTFRVPRILKDTKREAYVPQRVSLGPYHHASADLPPMGHHKGRALRRMMKRFNISHRNLPVVPNNMDFADGARAEILKLENEIRDSYEESIDCDGETLARMLYLDGCFLLEVLRTLSGDKVFGAEADECYDPIFGKDKLQFARYDILYDILILENQIPLIILRKLLELELNSADGAQKHLNMLMGIISAVFNPFDNKNTDKEECWSGPEQEVHHLLGFLHTNVIASPSSSRQREFVDQGKCSIHIDCCNSQCIRLLRDKNKAGDDVARIPHAVELRNAGIKFKPLQGGIKEIKFDENSTTIFLPPISITDLAERVFRNLIAYEMCKPSEINYVSCYVSLMDRLIDSEEDVALLIRMGVLTNYLGSDIEVADLFNGLCKEVVFRENDLFNGLKQKVSAHYSNKWKVRLAELMRDHFSSPWKILALLATIVVLVFTALQTIYTMK